MTHGRFIAGYHWSCNDERVYFNEIFDNTRDAALMSDEHARVIAEREMEYQKKWRDAQNIETDNEEAFARLRECLRLRNDEYFAYVRNEIHALIETIKGNRARLETEFKGILC